MTAPLGRYNAELLALTSAVLNIRPYEGRREGMTTTERKAAAVKWRNWQTQLKREGKGG